MAELDKKYADFHATWKGRLGLKDIHIAEAYMRGEALDAAGYGTLPEDPTKSGIHIRVEGRGLDAYVDPEDLDTMIADWQAVLDENGIDKQREFTKDYIAEIVALNAHLEPDGGKILLGAVWLVATESEAMEALREPGNGLLCEFIYDDDTRTRRLRKSILTR